MLKPIHAFRTTGVRVVRGGIPIVAECGHVVGIAFGEELKVIDDLRDSPTCDTSERMPLPAPGWNMDELKRLEVALGGAQ